MRHNVVRWALSIALVLGLALFLQIPRMAYAAAIVVAPGGGGNYTTIQAAVNNASPGDVIAIKAGSYSENVDLSLMGSAIGGSRGNLALVAVGSIRLAPDKRSFSAGEAVLISVTITNIGDAPSTPAWADFFINPSTPPTTANVTWNLMCKLQPCFDLTWQVPALNPGQSVTLTSTSGSYAAAYSIWPRWFAAGTSDLYLYVDSWNPGVTAGAVAEGNESNNRAELHGLIVGGANPALSSQRAIDLSSRSLPVGGAYDSVPGQAAARRVRN